MSVHSNPVDRPSEDVTNTCDNIYTLRTVIENPLPRILPIQSADNRYRPPGEQIQLHHRISHVFQAHRLFRLLQVQREIRSRVISLTVLRDSGLTQFGFNRVSVLLLHLVTHSFPASIHCRPQSSPASTERVQHSISFK